MTNLNNPFNLFSLLEEENTATPNEEKTEKVAVEEYVQNVSVEEKTTKEVDCTNNPVEATETTETVEKKAEESVKIESATNENVESNSSSNNDEANNTKDNNPFSMFEQLSEKAEKAEKEQEKAEVEKSKTTKKPSTQSKPKEEPFEVNEFTTVRHFGQVIPLTDYFTVEEITKGVEVKKKDGTVEYKKIDGAMVRRRMEKDYPELVPGHTEMIYYGGKRNFIIPTIFAKKKGNIDVKQEVSSSNDDTSFPFPKKIPFHLLESFIAIAKMFGAYQLEVRAEIYYNFNTEQFLMHIPRQTVNKYWVISDESPGYFQTLMLDKHEHIVQLACEIHSHHIMAAFPSETDNQAERVPKMYYVIVGKTNEKVPSVYCRTFSAHKGHIKKSLSDLFEVYEDNSELLPWSMDDITIKY